MRICNICKSGGNNIAFIIYIGIQKSETDIYVLNYIKILKL